MRKMLLIIRLVGETDLKVEMIAKNVRDVGLDPMQDVMGTLSDWPLEFERLQKSILELWQICNVSLVHSIRKWKV